MALENIGIPTLIDMGHASTDANFTCYKNTAPDWSDTLTSRQPNPSAAAQQAHFGLVYDATTGICIGSYCVPGQGYWGRQVQQRKTCPTSATCNTLIQQTSHRLHVDLEVTTNLRTPQQSLDGKCTTTLRQQGLLNRIMSMNRDWAMTVPCITRD